MCLSLIVIVICQFFSIENLENTEKHKAKEINVANLAWSCMLPVLHCVLSSLLCASAVLFFKQNWVNCHICGSIS